MFSFLYLRNDSEPDGRGAEGDDDEWGAFSLEVRPGTEPEADDGVHRLILRITSIVVARVGGTVSRAPSSLAAEGIGISH
jgi:hypothetical protein